MKPFIQGSCRKTNFFLCFLVWLLGILLYQLYEVQHQPLILRIGVFAGSNWNVPDSDSYAVVDAAIQQFEQAHSGVKVRYVSGIKREDYSEWLAEQIMNGTEPDVFMILSDDFNLYASLGALRPLELYAQGDRDFMEEVYYPAALSYGQFGGQQYALPFESVPTLMFVNKTLLAQEGIAMPANDWTWQDFLRICRQVTRDRDGDGVLDQFGCYDYNWQQAVVADGLKLFREDGRASYFADSRMEETVRFLMDLRDTNRGHEVTAKDFDMGRVAFRPFTFAEYRTYKPYPWRIKKYTSFEWDCIKMPAGPSGSNISELGTLLIGMSARSKHEELAWQFLKELCYDRETQKRILTASPALPVRRDVVESADTRQLLLQEAGDAQMNVATISEVMDEAAEVPKFKRYSGAMLMADNELRKIINGTVTFNNALNKLQKEINAYLQY